MSLWPHQQHAIRLTLDAIVEGKRRILLVMPTGTGKSLTAFEIARHYLDQLKKVSIYSNRKMLVEQTSNVLEHAGHAHGVRMAGSKTELDERLQISSIQTEAARVLRKKRWNLHDSSLIVLDEAHLNSATTAAQIIEMHLERRSESVLVGLTATPLDLAHFYDHLIVACTVSEGRACGALVPAIHYGPDEPDLRHVGRVNLGDDLTENQNRKAMGQVDDNGRADQRLTKLFGRVFEWYGKLNRDRKPAILFAPGVAESVWFAEQFHAQGIPAAHIDGEDVWVDGEFFKTSRTVREEVLKAFRAGEIKMLTNRFVLREGIDLPCIEHMIFATVVGSLGSFIQMGGRGLRASPDKTHCIIQDHAGNWHRHGSLNADRDWQLDHTNQYVAALRQEKLRAKEEQEPFLCPQCSRVLTTRVCPSCGYEIDIRKRSRMVVQSDGSLKEMFGDIYRQRFTQLKAETVDLWRKMYYRARNGDMTFRAARGLFFVENGYYPPDNLKLMPKTLADWCAKVADVPMSELH